MDKKIEFNLNENHITEDEEKELLNSSLLPLLDELSDEALSFILKIISSELNKRLKSLKKI